jgi:SNF2 family DNA or RNA helicase
VLCSTWRIKSTSAARSEIDAQEKFISFFKVGVLTRVMSGRDSASLDTGAGATLPPKVEEELRVAMSTEEIVAHRRLAAGMDRADKPLKKVDLLHQFARLSQHPLLLGSSGDGFSVEELKGSSSKLRAVLEVLQRVKASGEKALVFARHLDVQRMLARVLSAEFQTPVRVVNGETPRSPSLRDTAVRSRKQIIEHFSRTPGFQVSCILPISPADVRVLR